MQCWPQLKVETRGGAKVEDKTRAKLNAALPGQVGGLVGGWVPGQVTVWYRRMIGFQPVSLTIHDSSPSVFKMSLLHWTRLCIRFGWFFCMRWTWWGASNLSANCRQPRPLVGTIEIPELLVTYFSNIAYYYIFLKHHFRPVPSWEEELQEASFHKANLPYWHLTHFHDFVQAYLTCSWEGKEEGLKCR